jgi:hypothetical protein
MYRKPVAENSAYTSNDDEPDIDIGKLLSSSVISFLCRSLLVPYILMSWRHVLSSIGENNLHFEKAKYKTQNPEITDRIETQCCYS